MVFCDKCNICVHQMCYGITSIPDGSWLCKTCALGIKPDCVLCPNKGTYSRQGRNCCPTRAIVWWHTLGVPADDIICRRSSTR